jgi:hypothetical protein
MDLDFSFKKDFTKNDEKKIMTIIKEYQEKLIGAWNEYFNQQA